MARTGSGSGSGLYGRRKTSADAGSGVARGRGKELYFATVNAVAGAGRGVSGSRSVTTFLIRDRVLIFMAQPITPIPATPDRRQGDFWRENFYVLLLAGLFLFTFLFWYYNPNPDLNAGLREINQGIFYALLAVFGVRNARGTAADRATPSASTQTGDIIAITPNDPAGGPETKPENAKSNVDQ